MENEIVIVFSAVVICKHLVIIHYGQVVRLLPTVAEG